MKKGVAIFFLVICLFQVGGIFILYRLHQGITHFRLQSDAYNQPELLWEFNFSHAEYEQVRLNWREIRIEGRMYDIRTIEKGIDSVYISAHRDMFEEHLIASINRTLNPQHPLDKSRTVILFKISLLNYLIPENNLNIVVASFGCCFYAELNFHYTDIGLKILSPPPKVEI